MNSPLYRGAQPDNLGIQNLKARGIRTVVNLRETNDEWPAEQDLVQAAGMKYVHEAMNGWKRPHDTRVREVLDILEGRNPAYPLPVFVHCQHGCDRTGTIIACYRIDHEGWTTDQALREANMYEMAKEEILLRRYVREFGNAHAIKSSAKESR